MRIDHATLKFGVFGDPIAHSKSPLMMNTAFEAAGVQGIYMAFHVTPDRLRQAVDGIRGLGLRGVNVTIPHKQAVMAFLDEIDENARVIGAVNTIVNEGGRLIGYNTDGIGYVRSLKEETGVGIAGKRILILGAGGAARGIAYALACERPERIWIANRTEERAAELASSLAAYADFEGMGMERIADIIHKVDIVINTTSVGMHPNVDERPADPRIFQPGTLFSDLIYNPLKTKWLEEAEQLGHKVHGGLGMFVYQGAYAYEYWLGRQAPVEAMREAVERSLAKRA